MTEEVTYVGWDIDGYFSCFFGILPKGSGSIRPGEYKFFPLGPFSNECRGVSENFVLLPQILPCGTRVLSEDENEERLDNLRARIYLDPPVERNCFSQNLIVNTVLGDTFKDGLFVLLYNNGTTTIKLRKLLCNDRDVLCPWKFVLMHRRVSLHDFRRGSQCFPTVATAAAICLTRLTAQSLIAHNNRRLVRAGLPDRQSPDLPVCPDYNTYGSYPSLGQAMLSDDEDEDNAIDEWAMTENVRITHRIGPQSGGYSPTACASAGDVDLGDDGESSDGVNLDEGEASPETPNKRQRQE